MKHTLFATAAVAAALLALPAFAQTGPSGYVGAGYSKEGVETGGADFDGDGWTFDAAVAFETGTPFGVQITLDQTTIEFDDSDSSEAITGTAFLFTRTEGGAFAGFLTVGDSEDARLVGGGVEGLRYFPNVTLAGSIGFGKLEDTDLEFFGINGEVRYFVNDNLRLDAGIGSTLAEGGQDESSAYIFGVGAEYQFAATPFSVFAGASRSDGEDVEGSTFTIGARFNFGGGNLKSRDRTGASFEGFGLTGVF